MGTSKKYWRGIGQLADDKAFKEAHKNEFAENIPVDQFIGDEAAMGQNGTNRRDFLKFLGFSAAAVTLAACEAPVMNAIPYVVRPEEIVPGVANWYASSFYDGNDYCSIIVKTREGRPVKIEGNNMSKVTRGGVNARVHASVLSLYDSNRARGPKMRSGDKWDLKTWNEADTAIGNAIKGKKTAIISSTIISPATQAIINDFVAKNPGSKHVVYDAVSYSGLASAHGRTVPTYNLEKADVIVSIGADFLTNWVSPIEMAKQYAETRRVSKDKKKMSKHIQIEAILSLSGANADERFPAKPSAFGKIAVDILAGNSGSTLPGVKAVTAALSKAHGKAVVLCGSNDPAIQRIVAEINKNAGAYEAGIINTEIADLTHQGDDAAFVKFVKEEMAGFGAVIFYNSNPVYTTPKALGFADKLSKIGTKVSFNDRADETAALCDWICPDNHYLESWNDHKPRSNQYSLVQPVIRPLFNTRAAQETLMRWTDANNKTSYYDYLQNHWKTNVYSSTTWSFTQFWNQSVHDGVYTVTAPAPVEAVAVAPAANNQPKPVAAPVAQPVEVVAAPAAEMMSVDAAKAAISGIKEGTVELVIYQGTALGNGSMSNNPWLQELPDPITKITWDNVVTMHPADVKAGGFFGLDGDLMVRFDQMEDQLDIVKVKAGDYEFEAPVWAQPGQAKGTIGIALGYGRIDSFGPTSKGVGANAYPAAAMTSGNTVSFDVYNATVSKTDKKHWIATTQSHGTLMGRDEDIFRETTISEYAEKDGMVSEPLTMHTYKGAETSLDDVDLWQQHDRLNHKWGMAIDLNSCIGCGSCVVSCNAENNVHVVGKDEVRRSREMHWMRIDRYYTSSTSSDDTEHGTIEKYRMMENPEFDNPKVVFQPMMCQHCNHAPCETVCPVLATNHSSEGLNQMTYNRCVGTRYCANNCPYKVRRFNWFNYERYHRDYDTNQNPDHNQNPVADEYGRMVMNPDVVVRSRGVMEKCSMCVQRIQAGKLDAKKAGAPVVDGSIQTACSQSCPTNAIIFGDLNDENSEIIKWEQDGRKFEVLEVVGVRPSVFYMTKVWNREAEAKAESKGHAEPAKKEEAHH